MLLNVESHQIPKVEGDQPKYWEVMATKNVKKDAQKSGESINFFHQLQLLSVETIIAHLFKSFLTSRSF